MQAASTVPVVFVQVADPVAQGFVASMKQPGGNVTGFSLFEFSLGGKWLYLLKEIVPALAKCPMFNPDTAPYSKFFMPVMEAAATSLGVQLIATPVQAAADIEPALTRFARGLTLLGDSFTRLHQTLIADLAGRYHLPSIAISPKTAASWTTAHTSVWRANTDKQQLTSIESLTVRSLATFRCRRRPNTNSSAA